MPSNNNWKMSFIEKVTTAWPEISNINSKNNATHLSVNHGNFDPIIRENIVETLSVSQYSSGQMLCLPSIYILFREFVSEITFKK